MILLVDISPFRLVEPSLDLKMKSIAQARLRKEDALDVEDIKSRLREIREHSLEKLEELLKLARENFDSIPNVTTYFAENVKGAVETILDIAKDNKKFAVNKSSTISEILPLLRTQEDVKIIDTYSQDLRMNSESDKENPIQYWDLPRLSPSTLWSSFVDTSRTSVPFEGTEMEEKDFLGLLGANVVSTDGNIFFLQHLNNITKILCTAERIIVTVGIDRIVQTKEEAEFQTRCCGFFGLESVLSELFLMRDAYEVEPEASKGHSSEEKIRYDFKRAYEVHLIFLDNRRSEIGKSVFKELLACIGCRACGAMCPRAKSLKNRKDTQGYKNPKELLLIAFARGLEESIGEGLFDCSICGSCEILCPVDIPLYHLILLIRERAESQGLIPEVHKKISESISIYGTPYGAKPEEVKDGQ